MNRKTTILSFIFLVIHMFSKVFFIICEFNLFVKYLNSIIAKIDCATYLHKLLSVINHSVPILFMGNPP